MFVGGGGATKRDGEGAVPEPAVSKPRLAVPPQSGVPMVSLASSVPVPMSSAGTSGDVGQQAAMSLQNGEEEAKMNQAAMMEVLKKP